MKFTLSIDIDSDATRNREEIARLIAYASGMVRNGEWVREVERHHLRDINGNTVGYAGLESEQDAGQDGAEFHIWSREHGMWWRANRQGYTPDLNDAGRYTREEAAEITMDHLPAGEEVAVRVGEADRFDPETEARLGLRDRMGRRYVELDLGEDLIVRSPAQECRVTVNDDGDPYPGFITLHSGSAFRHWEMAHPEGQEVALCDSR